MLEAPATVFLLQWRKAPDNCQALEGRKKLFEVVGLMES